tara:strand:+ start:124 stop:294 length:171 start_codon:yes stop_codon:yes gene_type:complete
MQKLTQEIDSTIVKITNLDMSGIHNKDEYNQCVIHTNEAIQILEKIKNKLLDKAEV